SELFFFQAEDGIRDFHVTGVQTCALPISESRVHASFAVPSRKAAHMWAAFPVPLPKSGRFDTFACPGLGKIMTRDHFHNPARKEAAARPLSAPLTHPCPARPYASVRLRPLPALTGRRTR